MPIYFSGGPLDGIATMLLPHHPLVQFGVHVVIEQQYTRPRGALDPPEPRRGTYVRVSNVALWWGWEGTRPTLAEDAG